ncbi:hypothetical protein BJ875DRAFT_440083 [Amylocarpus encephaloides]|uniref:Uncharacterized protein n=1 Tax=Amylocarpus encephaloides TaxID=45428 RepID=A0A9P7YL00_9HELO|nr:hypothetical protein BJ875DRAFT_440083 [Amylocarpus encephaloides]
MTARIEMVHNGPPLSLKQPTTLLSSPSNCLVTLSDAKELVKAITDMKLTSNAMKCTCSDTSPRDLSDATFSPTTKCCCSHTPPDSPDLQKPAEPVTLQDLKRLVLELIGKFSEDNSKVSDGPKLDSSDNTKSKEVIARVSLLAFKEVDKISWAGYIIKGKLSIERNILYNFLPEIKLYREKIDSKD